MVKKPSHTILSPLRDCITRWIFVWRSTKSSKYFLPYVRANNYKQFWHLFCGEIENNVLVRFMKTFTFYKPASNSKFKALIETFRKTSMPSKNCSESRLWSKLMFRKPVVTCRLEKIYEWQRRKAGTEILIRLSKPSLELVGVFKEARRNLIFIFLSLTMEPKNLKTICTCTNILI